MVWKRYSSIAVAAAAMAAFGFSNEARAQEPACDSKVTRDNLVACAVRASLTVRAQKEAVEAARGRRTAADPVLPAAPVVALSAAQRSTPGMAPTFNVYATLSQEIEIAGQRGARQRVADAGLEAEEKRGAVTERDTALAAWRGYFAALGAASEVRLAKRIEALSSGVASAVEAAAAGGLAAGVEGELAAANALRALQARLAAERAEKTANAALAALWGRTATQGALVIEGELSPLAAADEVARKAAPKPAAAMPAAEALDAERRAAEAKVDELSRARVPNLTLSVFVQRDGFNELVIGGGLSLPIPLPHPVTRTNAGEIAEAAALARKAATEAEAVRRKAGTDLSAAIAEYTARKTEVDAFSAASLARAEKSLKSLAEEVQAGRLALKDAAPAQQALIEVLSLHLAAKRALCLASVELARAAGLALESGAR